MAQSLVESPLSSQFGGGDEPAEFKVRRLEDQITEMQRNAARNAGNMSEANLNHYNFIKLHKQFEQQKLRTGDDIHLVLRPQGVLRQPGQSTPARIVCVLPEVAAEIMAFAGRRGQAVRPATAEEIKAYKDYNAKLTEVHQGRVAAEQARVARLHFEAILGQAATASTAPALPQLELPPEPRPILAGADPGRGLESPVMPKIEPTPTAAKAEPVATVPPERAVEEALLRIARADRVGLLVEAGYATIDSVADASPDELTKVKGIGRKTASELIVRASEVRAEREIKAEEAALQRKADDGARGEAGE